MTGLQDRMTATVGAIYAAAAGQSDWHSALDHVLDTMGFTHASVYAFDRYSRAAATDTYRLPVTGFWHRHDPRAQFEYETEYYKHEVGRAFILRNPHVRIRHDLMFTSEAEMDRSPFYDWAEREAGLRYMLLGQTDPDQAVGATLSLQRSRAAGATTPEEVARLSALLQHFQRAIQVEHQLGKALAPNVPSLDFMDRNPTGVVILDGLGRVVHANAAARGMAAEADGFNLGAAGIFALRRQDDGLLQKLIGAAARTGAGEGFSSGGAMTLARKSGRRGYALVVAPLARRESVLAQLMPAACILITDPERMPVTPLSVLRRLYGLTPQEAKLADRLMAGATPEQAATALGITVGTARIHLASIFRKTETHRQPELIRLLLTPPWWMLEDGPPA